MSVLITYLTIPKIIKEDITIWDKVSDVTLLMSLVALGAIITASCISGNIRKVRENLQKEQEKIRIHQEHLEINPNYDFFSAPRPEIHSGKRIIFQDDYRPKIQGMIDEFRQKWGKFLETTIKYRLCSTKTDDALINFFQRKLRGGTCFGESQALINLMVDHWDKKSHALISLLDIDEVVRVQLAEQVYLYQRKIDRINLTEESNIVAQDLSYWEQYDISKDKNPEESQQTKLQKIDHYNNRKLILKAKLRILDATIDNEIPCIRHFCETDQLFTYKNLGFHSFDTPDDLRRYLIIENATSHPMGTIGTFDHYDSAGKLSSAHEIFFQISENHYRYYDISASPAGMYDFPDEESFFEGLWKHLRYSYSLKDYRKHLATIYLPNYLPKPATMEAEDV